MERMIKPETLAIPTEGTVGYAKIEDCNYGGAEIQPRLFDVDSYDLMIYTEYISPDDGTKFMFML